MIRIPRIVWLGMAVALLQSGALYAMVEQRAAILRNGNDITLLTEPVDPRDFLRGDYVTLGYAISAIAAGDIAGTAPTARGAADIYVSVKRDGAGAWGFSAASWQRRDDLPEGEVQLHGQVRNVATPFPGKIRVNYGIERYYVPEGQGKAIEAQQRERRIEAVIAVSSEGDAQIRALKDNGAVLYEEPLY
ncbi:MAG: GDYXXLXY domain-containing protein [Alphaproteobacteria bacterium]